VGVGAIDGVREETTGSPTAERVEMHIDEEFARYHGEWVLMKVTEINEYDDEVRGIIIAHAAIRDAIADALAKEPPREPGGPYQPYYPSCRIREAPWA
jgi:hypothetical protein